MSHTIITFFLYKEAKLPICAVHMAYLQNTGKSTGTTYVAFYAKSQYSIPLSRSVLAFYIVLHLSVDPGMFH
jgi:hypothetical protein